MVLRVPRRRRHLSELLLPGFKAPTLLLRGARPNGLCMALFVRSGLSVSRRERFECSCCEFMVAKIPGERLNCYLFVVYRSSSTDDRVFDCLCEAMGSIQSVDPMSVFCFVGDINCYHSKWLESRITDAHGVADFDFATVADCSQLVNGPTHRAGGVLDLVLTNVPDLCDVHVHGNVGRSDHASLGVALKLSPAVAGFNVARRVPLKSRVNWNAVCEALSGLNWRSIFRSPTMVHNYFDREVSGIMERFVPMVTVRRRGGDAAWFDGDCRRAFELKQSVDHRWCRNCSAVNWDLFCQARGSANRLYAAAKARYSADCRRNIDDCASANAWWRTLKDHVFGAESDIPHLCSPGGVLVSDLAGKAELLSTCFDSKQSRDIVGLPQTCHHRPALCGIAFRAREVERHLLDLDPNGGMDPSGCFPMFFGKTASVLAPKLGCLFRRLLCCGEFPLEWRMADVTPIPKGPLLALVCNYRLILITTVLSKVFERLIALCFGSFLERSGALSSHQHSYRKGLGTCDALLEIICTGQLELDRGGDLELVQIDFSAAFDRVNHGGLVFKLREAWFGGLILKLFQNFLSSRTQRVKVDGVCSSSIDVISGVPQGSVLGPLLFLLYIADLPRLLQNELVGYGDNSTFLCRIPHPRDRSSVAAALNDDLAVISDWCTRWGMLVNPNKTRGCLFLVLVRLSLCSPTWWLMVLLWRWSLSWRFWV